MRPRAPLTRLKPRSLRAGDNIGIVAPASYFKREEFEAGCQALHRLGYRPVFSEDIFARDLYFAGPVERRKRELEEMFQRADVKAILCARGGYGSNYLLQELEPMKIEHPKVLVGYSDITTLLTYFSDVAGWVTFHGPMVAKDFAISDGVDLVSWRAALEGKELTSFGLDSGLKPLCQGSAEGLLYGGCLSMLVASLGTPYEIHSQGTILFMEDVATKPFQIDRMLMQLKLAGKLAGVRGIVFGEMLDCVQAPNQGYTLEEVMVRVVQDLQVPTAYGLRSGHVSRQNITLPIGARVRLTVQSSGATLEMLEPATVA
ncbi:MAG: LD-carboxypeptidase [Acidobacteria bacterium]|nr:LD-carboxypeptidase [Acidobacteriota bacterium]